jgi:peptidoglycan/xylan/chitin deacetylase (PgdA/CDA1 family)
MEARFTSTLESQLFGKEVPFLKNIFRLNAGDFGLPDHYRPRQYAAVWQIEPPDWRDRLAHAIAQGMGSHSPALFFRADDIGAGGRPFEALCTIFRHHGIPLEMGVVPAWLSAARRNQLFGCAPLEEPLWGWHQHGWRHVNWQRTGKKSEFGEQRPFEKQWRDIWQGRQKMLDVFGEHLISVFTPPWNRLSSATLKILQDLDFRGVSMTGPFPRGPKPPPGLKNFRIALDLHTRKVKDAALDFQNLLDELASTLGKREPSGIMIHHQRMTLFAFKFLDELLYLLKEDVQAHFLSFQEMLEIQDAQ